MRPDEFKIGVIFTYDDVPHDDWHDMRLLALEAQPGKKCIGRATINYKGHDYKTANRDGRLRFKRVT